MVVDWIVCVLVVLAVAFGTLLANDLLWDCWEAEENKGAARAYTWLIVANIVAGVVAGGGTVWLALRTTVW